MKPRPAGTGRLAEMAARSERPISRLGGGFMGDPSLLAAGANLGYESNDFYYAGRVGVMGEVSSPVAIAALVFFAPTRVELAWERSTGLQHRREAALLYTKCASEWAEQNFVADIDWQRIADEADRVIEAISYAGAPLYAGWMSMPDGETPNTRAQHRLNGLREYRMAVHGAAISVVGVSVGDAVRHAAPQHVGLFGWSPDFDDDPETVATRWQEAERITDRMMGAALSVLGDDLDDFVERCELAEAAVFRRP